MCQLWQSQAISILGGKMLGKRKKRKSKTREISPFNESCMLGLHAHTRVYACVCALDSESPMSKSWGGGSQEALHWHFSGLIGWALSSGLSRPIQEPPVGTGGAERTRLVGR